MKLFSIFSSSLVGLGLGPGLGPGLGLGLGLGPGLGLGLGPGLGPGLFRPRGYLSLCPAFEPMQKPWTYYTIGFIH